MVKQYIQNTPKYTYFCFTCSSAPQSHPSQKQEVFRAKPKNLSIFHVIRLGRGVYCGVFSVGRGRRGMCGMWLGKHFAIFEDY